MDLLARPSATGLPAAEQHQVVAVLAHELSGPVHALAISAEALLAEFSTLSPHQIRAQVGDIHRRTLWLRALLDNLLCSSLLQQGRLSLVRRPFDLQEAIAGVQSVVAPLLAERRQPVRVRAGPGRRASPLDVVADRQRLEQVLVNLLLNASKFSPEGAAIDIALSGRGAYARVTVADRGPGLPAGSEAQVFVPFYRAPTAAQMGKAGVGIGLAVVKSVIEEHGGRVGAENRPGGGARFWFELPVSSNHADVGA
jgi:signal transduction histidine kinase